MGFVRIVFMGYGAVVFVFLFPRSRVGTHTTLFVSSLPNF